MEKNVLSYLLLLVLCSSAVIAQETELTENGGSARDYFTPYDTRFIQELPSDSFTPTLITNPIGQPLIADLDGDGNNEVIFNDDGSLQVYNYSKVNNQWYNRDSILISGSEQTHSNLQILDFDGDGYDEIMVADGANRKFKVYNFSANNLYLESDMDFAYGNTDTMIYCIGEDECLIAGIHHTAVFPYYNIYVMLMNSTEQQDVSISLSSDMTFLRFSSIKQWVAGDRNSDGVQDYGFPVQQQNAGTIFMIFMSIINDDVEKTSEFVVSDFDNHPRGEIRFQFSNPLMFPLANQAGTETVMAYNVDNVEDMRFRMWAADNSIIDTFTGTLFDDFEVWNVGNVFRTQIGSGLYVTVCSFGLGDEGYISGDYKAWAYCGNRQDSIEESHIMYLDASDGYYNVSGTGYINPLVSWTVMTEHPVYENACFLNTFGVVCFDNDNDLHIVWENPSGVPTQMTPVDYDGDGYMDFIGLSEEFLYFFNDGYTNERPNYVNSTFDPDIRYIVLTNTSFKATLRLNDDDDADTVSARAILYADTSNNQSVDWQKTDTDKDLKEFTFWWDINTGRGFNKTGTLQLRYEWNDSHTPETLLNYNVTIIVSDAGIVQYGDGSTYNEPTATDDLLLECLSDNDCDPNRQCEDNVCVAIDDSESNALTDAAAEFSGITGLSGGMIVILTIFIIGFAFITQRGIESPVVLIGGVIFIIFGGVIIGTKIGLISSGTIIVLVLLSLILLALLTFLFRGGGGD